MSIADSLKAMASKSGLHPYQRARIRNLQQLLRIYNNFTIENKKTGVKVFDYSKLAVFKRVVALQIGCTFYKLKEYCEELSLNIEWTAESE